MAANQSFCVFDVNTYVDLINTDKSDIYSAL